MPISSKRPELHPHIPQWRKRLDHVLLGIGILVASYQIAYVSLGLYYKDIDTEKERTDFRKLDDRINQMIYGKPLADMSPLYRKIHKHVSLIELAAKVREHQESTESEPQANISAEDTAKKRT
jgi:hypothetical protein